jgi:hypothetical protein
MYMQGMVGARSGGQDPQGAKGWDWEVSATDMHIHIYSILKLLNNREHKL